MYDTAGQVKYIFNRPRNVLIFSAVDRVGRTVRKLLPVQPLRRDRVTNILAIRLAHLGDVLFITPALRSLKTGYPGARLTVLAGSWGQAVLANNPYVDEVITLDAPWHNRGRHTVRHFLKAMTILWSVRKQRFDLAIQFGLDYRDNIVCALSNSSITIGHAGAGLGFLFSCPVNYDVRGLHAIDHGVTLAATAGSAEINDRKPEIYPTPEDEEQALALLEEAGVQNLPFALVHPGTGDRRRLWKAESFAAISAHLWQQYRFRVILCGAKEEIASAREIEALSAPVPPCNMVGRTSLPVLSAMASRARVCIGLESFFVHMAAAMEAPTVAIYSGFTDTRRWRPYGERVAIIKKELDCTAACRPDDCRDFMCLQKITADEVLKAVAAVLDQTLKSDAAKADSINGKPPGQVLKEAKS